MLEGERKPNIYTSCDFSASNIQLLRFIIYNFGKLLHVDLPVAPFLPIKK